MIAINNGTADLNLTLCQHGTWVRGVNNKIYCNVDFFYMHLLKITQI